MIRTNHFVWRLGAVALVLIATFVETSIHHHTFASERNQTRQEVEEQCLDAGGIYWEDYNDGGDVSTYGCAYTDGGPDLSCDEFVSSIYGWEGCRYSDEVEQIAPAAPSRPSARQRDAAPLFAAEDW